MADDQKDPTERERVDEDLEMDEEQAEDVKGGALMAMQDSGGTTPTTTTTTTSPTGSISGSTGGSYPTKYKQG